MTTLTRTTRSRRPRLRGAFTALVTPFTRDGTLDEPAFRRLVAWQILAGIDGLVPCGTTGESPTLTIAERERLIELTVEIAAERPSRDRIAVIAGTGTNDTDATIAATRRAADPRRRRGARRGAVLQPPRRADARGPLPGGRRRGRPSDRRLQRPVADGHERRRRHVPPAGRASADRGGQGSVAATSSRSPGSVATARATWPCWPATTPGHCRSSRSAAMVSSRSPATRSPARWPGCARPRGPGTGMRRGAGTNAGCR